MQLNTVYAQNAAGVMQDALSGLRVWPCKQLNKCWRDSSLSGHTRGISRESVVYSTDAGIFLAKGHSFSPVSLDSLNHRLAHAPNAKRSRLLPISRINRRHLLRLVNSICSVVVSADVCNNCYIYGLMSSVTLTRSCSVLGLMFTRHRTSAFSTEIYDDAKQ